MIYFILSNEIMESISDMVSFHCRLISSFHAGTTFFDNFGLSCFLKKFLYALFLSDITLPTYSRHIKQLTSHFDVTLA